MTILTQYGRMAEKHWREFLPIMVKELEARGHLHQMRPEAKQKTDKVTVARQQAGNCSPNRTMPP